MKKMLIFGICLVIFSAIAKVLGSGSIAILGAMMGGLLIGTALSEIIHG